MKVGVLGFYVVLLLGFIVLTVITVQAHATPQHIQNTSWEANDGAAIQTDSASERVLVCVVADETSRGTSQQKTISLGATDGSFFEGYEASAGVAPWMEVHTWTEAQISALGGGLQDLNSTGITSVHQQCHLIQGVTSAVPTDEGFATSSGTSHDSYALDGAANSLVIKFLACNGSATVSSQTDSLTQVGLGTNLRGVTLHTSVVQNAGAKTNEVYNSTTSDSENCISWVANFGPQGTFNLSASDVSPRAGESITFTIDQAMAGNLTSASINGDTCTLSSATTTSGVCFFDLAQFVSGGTFDNVDWGTSYNITVTDGTDTSEALAFQIDPPATGTTQDATGTPGGVYQSGTLVGSTTYSEFTGGSGSIATDGTPTYTQEPATVQSRSYITTAWSAVKTTNSAGTDTRKSTGCAGFSEFFTEGFCPANSVGVQAVATDTTTATLTVTPDPLNTGGTVYCVVNQSATTLDDNVIRDATGSPDWSGSEATLTNGEYVLSVPADGTGSIVASTQYYAHCVQIANNEAENKVLESGVFITPGTVGGDDVIDWNPGLYSKSNSATNPPSWICDGDAASDAVAGIRLGIPWGQLETSLNTYDFSLIDNALSTMKTCGDGNKRVMFVVQFQDSHADAFDNCAPRYLFDAGWVAVRDDPTKTPRCTARIYEYGYALERYQALLTAVGNHVMASANEELVEAVAVYGEWSIGSHYTPDRATRLEIIENELCSAFQAAAPRKQCLIGTGHFGNKATVAEKTQLRNWLEAGPGLGVTFPDTHANLNQFNAMDWADDYCEMTGKVGIHGDNQRAIPLLTSDADLMEDYFHVAFENAPDTASQTPVGGDDTVATIAAYCMTHFYVTSKTGQKLAGDGSVIGEITQADKEAEAIAASPYDSTCPTNVTNAGWTCATGRTP